MGEQLRSNAEQGTSSKGLNNLRRYWLSFFFASASGILGLAAYSSHMGAELLVSLRSIEIENSGISHGLSRSSRNLGDMDDSEFLESESIRLLRQAEDDKNLHDFGVRLSVSSGILSAVYGVASIATGIHTRRKHQ